MRSRTTDFEGLLEAVPDALVGVDRAGVILCANHRAESLFGYDRDALVGMPLENLVPTSLRSQHRAHREGYNADPRTRPMGTDLNLTGQRRDGTEFPVDISLNPTGTGDDLLVMAAVRDMTRYQHVEAERRRLDRTAALVEFSGEAIVSHTLNGIITSWNPAAERLLGFTSQEAIGRPLVTMTAQDRGGEVRDILEKVSRGRPTELLETVGIRKDGSTVPIHLSVSPILDESGSVIGASAIIHNSTLQQQTLEAAQLMASVIEHSGEAIITSSLNGIITSWNPAAERLFGYSSEEIVGKSGKDLNPSDRTAEVREILTRIGTGEPVGSVETQRVRKDGTVFPAMLTISPIRDKDDQIVGASAIIRDITYQKRTFESARSMIETSLDSFVAISPEGVVTDANEATVKISGVPRSQLIGGPFSDLFTDPVQADELCRRVFAEGKAEDYPLTLRHRNGHVTSADVLYNASVYRDTTGNVLGAFAAARDITEQQKAAQYARSLIEAALDPMVTISPEGTITDANEATARATGVPRDRLIGTSFSDYFTDPERAEEGYQLVFEQGSVRDYPLTLRHTHGRESHTEVLYNASLYRDAGGSVLGVFATAHDVTKQVRAQKELAEQQARELERLAELEHFQRLTVGRELKMIELKKKIEYLRKHGPGDGGERGDEH